MTLKELTLTTMKRLLLAIYLMLAGINITGLLTTARAADIVDTGREGEMLTGSRFQGEVLWDQFATGFEQPTDIANAGDSRLFVVERAGRIYVLQSDGEVLERPFLDIRSRVGSSGREQGLLGLAFHPDYAENGYFFVNYTNTDGDTRVSRFSVSATDSDIADGESERLILGVPQPATNHNAGDLAFGPDGYLYIPLGDGGGGGDLDDRAQDGMDLLGKILRVDVDQGSPYAVPENNPFIGNAEVLDEIWALGLRNPWRVSFDRVNGDLYIADVGQGSREEINFQLFESVGGENYGWRCYEGTLEYDLTGCDDESTYVFPVAEYAHDYGCSIAGGFAYRGLAYPQLRGRYFFGDFCSGNLWTLEDNGSGGWELELIGDFDISFTTFGEDAEGELYAADYADGILYRLTFRSSSAASSADFDGDGDTDVSLFRPTNGRWYIHGEPAFTWGLAGDIPVPADYDGDGDVDPAVFRPANGRWYILGESSRSYGMRGDVPVPCDYDGDEAAEIAVFRPANGRWYILGSSATTVGKDGDMPVPGDYDGDGVCEIGVFRPTNGRWYIEGHPPFTWGLPDDLPVHGDYDGDSQWEAALFRPANGRWYIRGEASFIWGLEEDIPVVGDYDGDGDSDPAVFRPANGRWYVRGGGTRSYGMKGDFPLPARDTNGDGDAFN
jgi:glucose/arabinose dehydrogenase